jgi:hypothetical protein
VCAGVEPDTTSPQKQRPLAHYGDEWISLISRESNSLLSELRGQLESPGDFRRPRSTEPPGSSVYDSDRGENSNFQDSPIIPGPSRYQQASLPRTPVRNHTVEDLISFFPSPPALAPRSPKGKQSRTIVEHEEKQGIVETSTKANLLTPDTSRRVDTPTSFVDSSPGLHSNIFDVRDQCHPASHRTRKQSLFARLSQTKGHGRTNTLHLRADPSRIHDSFSFDTLIVPGPVSSPSVLSTLICTPLRNVSPPPSHASQVDCVDQNSRGIREQKVSFDFSGQNYPSCGSRSSRHLYSVFPHPSHSSRPSFASTIRRVPSVLYSETTDPRFYRKTPFTSPLDQSSPSVEKTVGSFKQCFSRVWRRISSYCCC